MVNIESTISQLTARSGRTPERAKFSECGRLGGIALTGRVGYSVGDSLQGSPGGCPVNLSAPVRREHLSASSVHSHQISALGDGGWLRGRAEHLEGTTSYRVRRGRGVTRRAVHYLDVCAAHLDSAAPLGRVHYDVHHSPIAATSGDQPSAPTDS
jgi:hypothetical protein